MWDSLGFLGKKLFARRPSVSARGPAPSSPIAYRHFGGIQGGLGSWGFGGEVVEGVLLLRSAK